MKKQKDPLYRRLLDLLFLSRRLASRVDALERELDEYRRDSLRVAEVLDLIERQLTPRESLQTEADRH